MTRNCLQDIILPPPTNRPWFCYSVLPVSCRSDPRTRVGAVRRASRQYHQPTHIPTHRYVRELLPQIIDRADRARAAARRGGLERGRGNDGRARPAPSPGQRRVGGRWRTVVQPSFRKREGRPPRRRGLRLLCANGRLKERIPWEEVKRQISWDVSPEQTAEEDRREASCGARQGDVLGIVPCKLEPKQPRQVSAWDRRGHLDREGPVRGGRTPSWYRWSTSGTT